MRDINYNLGVTESEVNLCHLKPDGQRQINQRKFGIALDSMLKPKIVL